MKFYFVEDNGDLIAMECDQEPSWWAYGSNGYWRDSIAEAVKVKRDGLARDVRQKTNDLSKSIDALESFNRNVVSKLKKEYE